MNDEKENNRQEGKPSAIKRFIDFNREHPVFMNFIYIILTGCILVWLMMVFLDSWTKHGDESIVPSLKGNSIELASMTLENDGFKWEIADSVFESTQKPGTVVEQNPTAGSRVKPGRTVYLTIVAFSPKMVTVPDYMNVSARQGRSMFEGLGVNVHVVTVMSEYKDLVLGAKVNGIPLRPGQRIPVTSNVTLEVGGGNDSADDDIEPNLVMPDGGAYTSHDDELWDEDDKDDQTVKMLLGDD